MNARDVIEEVQKNASEWLEMSDNPDALVSGILATKIISLYRHIEYLERSLAFARTYPNVIRKKV